MLCSVIVPTYKEKLNLRPLITRVFAALDKTKLKNQVELIVVDDNSNDGSKEEVEALAKVNETKSQEKKEKKKISALFLRRDSSVELRCARKSEVFLLR
jgi:glycosyltransferase involved in cell wall biosynthesis